MLCPAIYVLAASASVAWAAVATWTAVFGLLRMHYHIHDALHGQLGCAWVRVARWASPAFLINAHNWMHIEHGPYHAHTNDFPADPDDFDRVLRGDIAKAATIGGTVLFGSGRPLLERIACIPAWLAVASVASVNWRDGDVQPRGESRPRARRDRHAHVRADRAPLRVGRGHEEGKGPPPYN
jgi:hypothetical protein